MLYFLLSAGYKLELFDNVRFSSIYHRISIDAKMSVLDHFLVQFNEARENNWELAKTRLQLCPPPDCLESIIHQDLINDFMNYVEEPTFDLDQEYPISIWEPAPYLMFRSQTLIYAAAFYGAINIFKYLYINKAELSIIREVDQKSIVALAVAGGNVEILRLLEQANVDFDTCIHDAAEFDQYDAFVWLDQMIFQDLSILDFLYRTVLHSAAISNSIDMALYVLDHTFDGINSKDISNVSPIFRSALNGSIEIMEIFFHVPGISVNSCNAFEQNVLHIAAIYNDVEITKTLIQNPEINVNEIDSLHRGTPLALAVKNGCTEVARILLEVSDTSISDAEGNTLVHIAAAHNHLEILKFMVDEKKMDVNLKNVENDTPLCLAIDQNCIDVVKYLVTVPDLNINEPGKNGNSPLIVAIMRHYPDIVKVLVDQPGIDINKPDSIGSSPICLATIFNDVKSVKILCDRADLDINTQTRRNKSVFDLAKRKEIKSALLKHRQKYNK